MSEQDYVHKTDKGAYRVGEHQIPEEVFRYIVAKDRLNTQFAVDIRAKVEIINRQNTELSRLATEVIKLEDSTKAKDKRIDRLISDIYRFIEVAGIPNADTEAQTQVYIEKALEYFKGLKAALNQIANDESGDCDFCCDECPYCSKARVEIAREALAKL